MNKADFETFEQQFIELVGEFQSLTLSESKLRESLRGEATRAEAAEARAEAAERSAADARADAAAAAAAAAHATRTLAATQDELLGLKIQLDFSDRQHKLTEEKITEVTEKLITTENELEELRPLKSAQSSLQRQYVELHKRTQKATSDARDEANKLENELRRVERCASAGCEVRERARLAAAAHARDRRLAAAELHHAIDQLRTANTEITRLAMKVAELQHQLSDYQDKAKKNITQSNLDTLQEVRASLEAEKAGALKLEKALAAALADNAILAAQLHSVDNSSVDAFPSSPPHTNSTNICPIDSFLAD